LPLIALLLVCFGLLPRAQAVGPDTDGSIAGSNNGEGIGVLVSRNTGVWNTGTGFEALNHLTSGNQNTATGLRALFSDTNGSFNTATGLYALYRNTTGWYNSAVGAYALVNNTIGNYNTANGVQALQSNRSGDGNTANGAAALLRNTYGGFNTANGYLALVNNTTGFNNTALGINAGSGITTANNVIAIGTAGANVSNSCFIGHIRGVTTAVPDAIPVLVDSAGQLGTVSSSARFKKEIKPMDSASESILALKPVTFHYKSDASGTPQFGLIAEEVAEVYADLVVRDKEGKPYTVRYDAVNAMLVNEFLKEHCTVQELKSTAARQEANAAKQEATIARQQKQIEALVATVKEQATQIQKVSAQLDVRRPALQTALNIQ